jgi:magnesium transporter
VIATIFMPLTFVTGLYGMNVDLPHFGLGGVAMFWMLMAIMVGIVVAMIVFFHRRGWI